MHFEMEIRFASGASVGDDSDPAALAELGQLLIAKANGQDHIEINVEGGRTRTVGDIRSIDLRARW